MNVTKLHSELKQNRKYFIAQNNIFVFCFNNKITREIKHKEYKNKIVKYNRIQVEPIE